MPSQNGFSDKESSLEKDPRVVNFVRNIIRRSVRRLLQKQFPNIDTSVEGEEAIREGASGAMTVQVKSQVNLMYKLDLERAEKEIQGFLTMEKVLPTHTLKLIDFDASAGWLCIAYLASAKNLHQIVSNSLLDDSEIESLYDDFLRQMLSMWMRTYRHEEPDPNEFLQRLYEKSRNLDLLEFQCLMGRMKRRFSEISNLPMKINGIEYPSLRAVGNIAARIFKQNPAVCSVTAHRDEHAKNILVQMKSEKNLLQWFLIDLPNVNSASDWVWSIAQMRQWWQTSYYISQVIDQGLKIDRSLSDMQITDDKINIQYELKDNIPPICRILDKKVEDMAHRMSLVVDDVRWEKRYSASMFLTYFSLLSHYSEREDIIPILMGESARALSNCLEFA